MKEIVSVSGFLLSYALDILEEHKIVKPTFIGYTKDNREIKEIPKGLSLEETIPKVLDLYENNKMELSKATICFPAELENESGVRESVVIIMVQNYETKEYLTISHPYKFSDSKLILSEFELLDYSPFLLEELPKLEKCFIQGALSCSDAEHIWSERFKAS